MRTETRKASDIYKKQNVLLHKAFAAAGMPYGENKDTWLNLMKEIAGRAVTGLSALTLWERHQLIRYFQRRGIKLFTPAVPENMHNWKKGDADAEHKLKKDDDPQARLAYAIWSEMGYRPKTLRGLCWKLFKRDDPRWLNNRQLSHLVNVVMAKAAKKGIHYYRK